METEAQTLARAQLEVPVQFVHLAHGDLLHLVVRRGQEVEFQYIIDHGVQHFPQAGFIHHVAGQVVVEETHLAFALHQKVVLLVEEDPGHQVTQVAFTVELEGVAQEVVDVYHPEVATHLVLFQVACLPQAVALVQLEDVGVHVEDDGIARDAQLAGQTAFVREGDHEALILLGNLLFQVRRNVFQREFQLCEQLRGGLEDILLHGRLGAQGLHDQLARRRGAFLLAHQ